MTKFGKYDEYPPGSLESAEAALLTAWRSLERYHDDLVLVGGLAVHCLTRRGVPGLPGAVTLPHQKCSKYRSWFPSTPPRAPENRALC
jgi:hypothetical protein